MQRYERPLSRLPDRKIKQAVLEVHVRPTHIRDIHQTSRRRVAQNDRALLLLELGRSRSRTA